MVHFWLKELEDLLQAQKITLIHPLGTYLLPLILVLIKKGLMK